MHLSPQRKKFESNLIVNSSPKKIKCDCCGFFSRDFDDVKSIQEFGVCTECKTNFEYLFLNSDGEVKLPSEKIARRKIVWRT